jgi:hypothetical protein
MAGQGFNREVRSGELPAALSIVFAIASVLNGWLVVWPVTGLILAFVGHRKALPGAGGNEARWLSLVSAWICGLAMVGWISYLIALTEGGR